MAQKTKDPIENLSFEQSLEKLEKIVEAMEEGEIPLEQLIEKFDQGHALLMNCTTKLKSAEFKVEKLKTASKEVFEAFEEKNTQDDMEG